MTEPRNILLPKHLLTLTKEERDSVYKSYYFNYFYDLIDSLFITRPNSPIILFYIRAHETVLGPETVSLFYRRLSNESQNSEQGEKIKEFLERSVLLQKGNIIENFSMKKTNGEKFFLYSVSAKYILLDFWASSCGPCRIDNPVLVNLYNKFKERV